MAREHDLLTGFAALDDNHAVEVSAPTRFFHQESGFLGEDCTHYEREPRPQCQLVRVGPIRFKRFRF
jgi:hypothetical protein